MTGPRVKPSQRLARRNEALEGIAAIDDRLTALYAGEPTTRAASQARDLLFLRALLAAQAVECGADPGVPPGLPDIPQVGAL